MYDSLGPQGTAAHQAPLSFIISWSLLKLMSIESMMPSNHLILCRPLLLLPSIFPSIQVFSNESALCIRWPKYWSFSVSSSNEYSGLISFRIDWFDLFTVQGGQYTALTYSLSYLEPVCCSMSSSNCCFLTCIQISQKAGQVIWYSHLFQNFPQFFVIHTVKGFGIVNKAEIDVFLEHSCFFDDPMDVGNLISGSSAFSKNVD